MQNAPSVIYPTGRSAFYRWLLGLVGALGTLVILAGWWRSWAQSPWNTAHSAWAVGLFVSIIWLGVAMRLGLREPSGSLRWSAQAVRADGDASSGAWVWLWHDQTKPPSPVKFSLAWDGQARVLLRLRGVAGADGWFWFERGSDPLRWDDFRRALTAHPGQE